MNNLFRLHDYLENMKAIIAMFSLKGKVEIWGEDVNNVRGIWEDYLNWSELQRLFRKNYLSKRYYDYGAKYFYELKMGSMTNEEYTSILLDMLRYVPYIKKEKLKIHRFISGLSVALKDGLSLMSVDC